MTNHDVATDLAKTVDALRKNGFEVWCADNHLEAEQIFWQEIFDKIKPHSVSWGDSMTLHSTGILAKLKADTGVALIETFGDHLTGEQQMHNRKMAFAADMFLTGSNAVTSKGQLVNLDMTGNRVAAITFGPEHVVLFIGVNKIVPDLEAAKKRIQTIAAPINAKRHPDFKTPCQVTGVCSDCSSPKRICNVWTITEKSYPVGRIKIIFINEELGL